MTHRDGDDSRLLTLSAVNVGDTTQMDAVAIRISSSARASVLDDNDLRVNRSSFDGDCVYAHPLTQLGAVMGLAAYTLEACATLMTSDH